MGSSATISAGVPIRPMPIIARWRMPPENSWGYWCARRSGVGDPHRPQPVDGTGQRRLAAEPVVVAGHLGELAADAAGRVERGHRVLEHHRQGGAEQAPLHLRVPRRAGRCRAARAGWRPPGPGRRRGARPPARSATCPTRTPPRCRPPRPAVTAKVTPRTGRIGPCGPGKVTSRSRTSSTRSEESCGASAAAAVGAVVAAGAAGRRRTPPMVPMPRPLATDSPKRLNASPATRTAMPGRQGSSGVDVDRADAVVEEATPVVARATGRRGRGRRARRRPATHPRRRSWR